MNRIFAPLSKGEGGGLIIVHCLVKGLQTYVIEGSRYLALRFNSNIQDSFNSFIYTIYNEQVASNCLSRLLLHTHGHKNHWRWTRGLFRGFIVYLVLVCLLVLISRGPIMGMKVFVGFSGMDVDLLDQFQGLST